MDPDWKCLPKHLLDSILERVVSLSDYLRFSVVCMAWHSVAKDNQSQRAKMTTPMLLISSEEENTWNLYNIGDDKVQDFQLKLPNKRFCGSSNGWLVAVEENFAVTLINAFSMVKGREERENSFIRLPPLKRPSRRAKSWFKQADYFVDKATISADPILNAKQCIVFVIYGEFRELALIRPNKDTKWTYVKPLLHGINEVVHIQGKVYAADNFCNLYSMDIFPMDSDSNITVAAHGSKVRTAVKKYLVYSNEKELLMVNRYIGMEDGKTVTKLFRIFKLDFEKEMWIKKESLDDVALFIGDNSSVSVLASNLRCQSNCIYFNHDNICANASDHECMRHNFGVYDVKNKSMSKPYTAHAMELVKMTKGIPIWVLPTFQL